MSLELPAATMHALEDRPDVVQQIALALRKMVLEVYPEAIENADRDLIAYGATGGYRGVVAVIMPQRAWVNLGIPNALELPDPGGLLEGTGKRHRHVKVRSVEAVESPALRALVEASAARVPQVG